MSEPKLTKSQSRSIRFIGGASALSTAIALGTAVLLTWQVAAEPDRGNRLTGTMVVILFLPLTVICGVTALKARKIWDACTVVELSQTRFDNVIDRCWRVSILQVLTSVAAILNWMLPAGNILRDAVGHLYDASTDNGKILLGLIFAAAFNDLLGKDMPYRELLEEAKQTKTAEPEPEPAPELEPQQETPPTDTLVNVRSVSVHLQVSWPSLRKPTRKPQQQQPDNRGRLS